MQTAIIVLITMMTINALFLARMCYFLKKLKEEESNHNE